MSIVKQNGFYPDHDHEEEPERVTCAYCGWDCDRERDSVCPMCGREDYDNFYRPKE